jgi:uncharacterized protein YndB with AHSA1/START domain
MWKKILGVVVLVIVAVLAYAATRPDTFHVERSIVIAAPPARIYALVDDFHQWGQWSPWEKLDPALQRTFSGPPSGVGAVYEWQGNRDVGRGRMDIVDATPSSQVGIALHFIEPFDSKTRAVFALTPEGDGTRVVWTMDGPALFVSKVMGLFVSMDRMIGSDFERGLANLKAVAERPS